MFIGIPGVSEDRFPNHKIDDRAILFSSESEHPEQEMIRMVNKEVGELIERNNLISDRKPARLGTSSFLADPEVLRFERRSLHGEIRTRGGYLFTISVRDGLRFGGWFGVSSGLPSWSPSVLSRPRKVSLPGE